MWAPDTVDPPAPFLVRAETAIERTRRDTWRSKEPETIAWIDSFTDGETFFDIGANVGLYSLYCASVHPHCRIIACEPDRKNFAALVENIELNAYPHITPAQYAVGAGVGVGTFYEAGATTGESGGQLDAALCNGMAAYPVARMTVDALAALYGCPAHIKIDIDGQEWNVVRGMSETLRNPALRSVLIEIDLASDDQRVSICRAMDQAGFSARNRFNIMSPHSRERRTAQGISVENVIFTR